MVDPAAVDRETLELFERTLRGVLGQPGVDVTAALCDVGWHDFLAADAASVVPLVFGVLGELVLASTALDDVAFAALGPTGVELRDAGHAFAHRPGAHPVATGTDDGLTIDAIVVGDRRGAPVTLVDGTRVVSVAGSSLEWRGVAGIDPTLRLARVRGVVAVGEIEVHPAADAGAVVPACRRALAHELLGATDAMLTMATEYAKVRQQFGQPIGAFQAVKHRLADVYVARQAAAAVVEESWRSDPECTTVAAKALAARAGALGVRTLPAGAGRDRLHPRARVCRGSSAGCGSSTSSTGRSTRCGSSWAGCCRHAAACPAPGRPDVTLSHKLDSYVKSRHTAGMMTTIDYRMFDADEHYYEPEDALTRHLDRKYRSAVRWIDMDGRRTLLIGGKLLSLIPNPTYDPVGRPGSLNSYFRAHNPEGRSLKELLGEPQPIQPEYRDRDAWVKVLDDQGVEFAWILPSLGLGVEEMLKDDREGLCAVARSYNEWLDDDWGYDRDGRIQTAPLLPLGDPEFAEAELQRLIARGVRLVVMRPAPVASATGPRSVGDPAHDRVWALAADAGVVVSFHAADDGYTDAGNWGENAVLHGAEAVGLHRGPVDPQ